VIIGRAGLLLPGRAGPTCRGTGPAHTGGGGSRGPSAGPGRLFARAGGGPGRRGGAADSDRGAACGLDAANVVRGKKKVLRRTKEERATPRYGWLPAVSLRTRLRADGLGGQALSGASGSHANRDAISLLSPVLVRGLATRPGRAGQGLAMDRGRGCCWPSAGGVAWSVLS
jgi:hypothetical protein